MINKAPDNKPVKAKRLKSGKQRPFLPTTAYRHLLSPETRKRLEER